MSKIVIGIALEAVGIFGALASILGLKTPYNYIVMTVSCVLLMVAFVSLLRDRFPIKPSFEIIQACKNLGIRRIVEAEYCHRMDEKISNARDIRIIASTAHALIMNHENDLVRALENNATIKLLIAKADSPYLKDLEILDGRQNRDLGHEVSQTLERLKAVRRQTSRGTLKIKYFSTQHRLTCVLCDDWAWLTLTIPPRRSYNSPSLELEKMTGDGLYTYCNTHFDEIWRKL